MSAAVVCVIGAGIMGLTVSWELARLGHTVVCVDRGQPGRVATGSTAGTLAIQNKRLGSIPLAIRAIEAWSGLAERLGHDVGYEVRGGLRVADDEPSLRALEESVSEQAALGAPVKMVYPPELFDRAPYLSRRVVAAGYCPHDGMGSPFAAVRGYLNACRGTGRVELRCGNPVRGIEARGDRPVRVRLRDGELECDALVLAAGAWIPRLLAPLGVELPLFTQIQQVLITDSGPPIFPHVVTHAGGGLTVKQQRSSGKVLVGGAWPGDGDLDSGSHYLRWSSVVGNARRAVDTIPGLADTRLLRGWTGFEGRSPDRLPVLGPVAGLDRIHVLGCAAGGFTLAPVCGRIAAELVTGQEPDVPHEPYLVSRFMEGQNPSGSSVATKEGKSA